MREIPKSNETWQHFKGSCYRIMGVGNDTETDKDVVVYQQLVEPYAIWVRPLDMFMSEVDHEKYPDVTQKYRFVKV